MIINAFTKLVKRTRWLQRGVKENYQIYAVINEYVPKKIYNIYIFNEPLSY